MWSLFVVYRHEKPQGAALGIGHGMQLGVQTALTMSDQAPASTVAPVFACWLEDVRRAFRQDASIITTFPWPPLEASQSIILANTLMSPHYFQRLKMVLDGPMPMTRDTRSIH